MAQRIALILVYALVFGAILAYAPEIENKWVRAAVSASAYMMIPLGLGTWPRRGQVTKGMFTTRMIIAIGASAVVFAAIVAYAPEIPDRWLRTVVSAAAYMFLAFTLQHIARLPRKQS